MQILALPETTVKQIVNYIQLTTAQRGLMARFGIRAASKHGTIVIARKCKCGTWQDYECDLTDTYRNRWEIQHAFEKLSGDDWRCATCRIPHTVKDVVSTGDSGGSGSKGTRSHRTRKSNTGYTRQAIAQFKRGIAEMSDWLHRVETGMVDAPADMVAEVKARLSVYIDIVKQYGRAA